MKSNVLKIGLLLAFVPSLLLLDSCGGARADNTVGAGAPPAAKVVPDMDVTLFAVEHPEQVPLVAATARTVSPELVVTGTVNLDVSRSVPVVSLVSGRVVAIHARVGDTVKKGQLLLSLRSDDVANGFSDYRKAVADDNLVRTQLVRASDLFGHGALSKNDLEVVQNAAEKAKVDVETKAEHLRLIGNDPARPNAIVDLLAPVSGIITDQQVTNSSGLQALGSNAFVIADLSSVWIVCDVYENDLATVRLGDLAEVRLNAFPGQAFKGTVSNIGASLDPNLRTAKVRVEVANPGLMRLGMFATATFRSRTTEVHTVVPASAILHMHDRDFVYLPAAEGKFRRVEVISGDALPNNMQDVKSGIKPGDRVVVNALVLEHTIDQ
jgi:cobalt-zinc-cadmium efflux system membrane fusion protein